MKFTVLISLFFGVFHLQSYAQNQNCECFVQGFVLDEHSKQPIPGAVVLLKEIQKGVLTDEKGFYKIDKVCQGKYTIQSRIIGYLPKEHVVNLSHEATQHFDLDEDEQHLANVEIKAEKIEPLSQPKQVLQGDELLVKRGANLAETLGDLAGINSLQTGSSIAKPVIHGMHSSRVLILNNGLRQEGQQWGAEHAPEVDPFLAQKITVIKGASTVRYGADAIAGVIKLEPNKMPDSTGVHGELNQVYFQNGRQVVSSAIVENAWKNNKSSDYVALRLQGTYKQGGNTHTANYYLANTGMNEKNYSGTLAYRFRKWYNELFFSQFNTKIGIFAGSHIGNVSDLIEAIQQPRPKAIYTPEQYSAAIDRPYQLVRHNLLKYHSQLKTELGTWTLTAGRQYNYRREIDVLRGSRNLEQRFHLYNYSAELLWEHKPLAQVLSGQLGLNYQLQQNLSTGTLKQPQVATVLIPNYQNLNMGLFAIEKIIKQKWEYEIGARLDIRQLRGYRIPKGQQQIERFMQDNSVVSGSVGVNYRPLNPLLLSANLATAWRAPSVNELYSNGVHHGTASFEQGNENLKVEKALNSNLAVQWMSKGLQSELQVYFNTISNYIFLAPTGRSVLTIRGAFPEFRYSQTSASLMGFDWLNQWWMLPKLSVKTKLSYLKARDLRNQQPLIFMPANRIENSLNFNHKIVNLELGWLYVSRQKQVPGKLVFNDIPQNEIVFNNFGGDFAPSPAAYNLLKMAVTKKLKFAATKSLDLALTIQNLLNQSYRDYMNRQRYYADDLGRNIAIKAHYSF